MFHDLNQYLGGSLYLFFVPAYDLDQIGFINYPRLATLTMTSKQQTLGMNDYLAALILASIALIIVVKKMDNILVELQSLNKHLELIKLE